MGGVDLAVHDDGAVEVLDRPVLAAVPDLHLLAGGLVVFRDGVVVDGVEELVVHPDALVRLGNGELGRGLGRHRRGLGAFLRLCRHCRQAQRRR